MTERYVGSGDNAPSRGLRRWRHPHKKQTYEEMGDGTVRVTDDDGKVGLFEADGAYISGELTQASMQMCLWVTAAWIPDECDYRWNQVPVDMSRSSGWPAHLEKLLHFMMGRPRS